MSSRSQAAQDVALREFLDSSFADEIALSPQTAAVLGVQLAQDRLDDMSEMGRERHVKLLNAQVGEMRRRFPTETLGDEGRLNVLLFEDKVERANSEYKWRHHIAPSSIDGGPDASAAFLVRHHTIDSTADAENYIARLIEVDRVLVELAERLETQRDLGIAPVERQVSRLRRTLAPYVTGAPGDGGGDGALLADFKMKVAALTTSEQERTELLARASSALQEQVRHGRERYEVAIEVVSSLVREHDGVWCLPDGEDFYAAALRRWSTTDMGADEIHDLGLAEVERIGAEQRAVLADTGFSGSLSEFAELVRSEERFRYGPHDREQCVRDATACLDAAIGSSPQLFRALPKAGIEVRPVEQWREATAPVAFYDPPPPDGSQPGVLYLNLGDMTQVQKIQLAGLVHHEGVPGHHFQVALAQERTDLPEFRRFGYTYGAYVEGWALYAERLADEMGLYGDPYARFGMLSLQMWRACRLVLDTGIHAKRWTRAEAVSYFTQHSSLSQVDIEREVDRYIGSPGQATSYLIGQICIFRLRSEAEKVLGSRFDIRGFHDAVLADGALPLNVLEKRVRRWIHERTS